MLFDKAGKDRLVAATDDKGTGITLLGTEGKPASGWTATDEGHSLVLFDKAGKDQAVLAVDGKASGLTLLQPDGKVGAGVASSADGASFVLFDANGEKLLERPKQK